jgi:RimJ/RimL family protein N-acetyltransferase
MQPHVAYWWPEPNNFDEFYAKWLERISTGMSAYNTPWFGHIIKVDTIPIGYIHYYRIKKDRYAEYPSLAPHTLGIDFFIGEPSHIGKKLSTLILHTYIKNIVKKENSLTRTLIIDPAITNTRAIHIYTKAGFKTLGTYTLSQNIVLLMYAHI